MAVAFEADIYLLESLQEDGVVLNKFVGFFHGGLAEVTLNKK